MSASARPQNSTKIASLNISRRKGSSRRALESWVIMCHWQHPMTPLTSSCAVHCTLARVSGSVSGAPAGAGAGAGAGTAAGVGPNIHSQHKQTPAHPPAPAAAPAAAQAVVKRFPNLYLVLHTHPLLVLNSCAWVRPGGQQDFATAFATASLQPVCHVHGSTCAAVTEPGVAANRVATPQNSRCSPP